MPLSIKGKAVMKHMMQEYGKEKGKEVFYATINAHKKGSEGWEGLLS